MIHHLLRAAALATACSLIAGCAAVVVGGVATGALIAADRRTSGTYVDDEAIEIRIQDQIYKKYGQQQVHVNATSFNRTVLLTGEVPDAATRLDAEAIARQQTDVRAVQNELGIAPLSQFDARTRDSYITTLVKTRFVEAGKFQANYVKVVTEARVVYLMGIVKRAEADAATEIARTTSDVAKVVRVFEYLD